MKFLPLFLSAALGFGSPLLANELAVDGIVDGLNTAGCEFAELKLADERDAKSKVPRRWEHRLTFIIPRLAPDGGGQFFYCANRADGDAIAGYFRLLPSVTGTYVFQSKDGRVVARLDPGLTAEQAEPWRAYIVALASY